MSDVVNIKDYKNDKYQENKLNSFINLTNALQTCYKTLRPFFKHKPVFILGKNIVDLRRGILDNIKQLKKEAECSE